ncbi:MAG: nuclear transport factor 2 family protein, partial [Myxococcota bacterium]
AERTVEQYRQAYEVRSLDALTPMYSPTPELVVISQGRMRMGWDSVRTHLTGLLSKATDVQLKISDMRITALGEGGVAVTCKLRRIISDGITTIREDGILTLTMRRDGDRWVIVSEHFSFPPGAG